LALTVGDDFILDALEIFEKQRVVSGRRVLGVLPRARDDHGSDCFHFPMQLIDFLARFHPKRKMVKRAGAASVDIVVLETLARG
jgi:hypothetical protein